MVLGFGLAVSCPPAAGAETVDLELVLAVDASGSVDVEEFELQLRGTANSFRDPAVIGAIQAGALGRIAVAMVLWADATQQVASTRWHVIASKADAERFASKIEALPRSVGGGTGIGSAVAASIRLIEGNAVTGRRRVIDVSGDGPETPPRQVGTLQVSQARAMARARGITVNGLAILSDVPNLDKWYSTHVTSGRGSFVIAAADFDDFQRAMRQKLLREISPPMAWNGEVEGENCLSRRNLNLRRYWLTLRLTEDDEKIWSYESTTRAQRGSDAFRQRTGRIGQTRRCFG